jgi:hypothetical protein
LVNFKQIKELPNSSLVGASTQTRRHKEPETKPMNIDIQIWIFIKILGDIIQGLIYIYIEGWKTFKIIYIPSCKMGIHAPIV